MKLCAPSIHIHEEFLKIVSTFPVLIEMNEICRPIIHLERIAPAEFLRGSWIFSAGHL